MLFKSKSRRAQSARTYIPDLSAPWLTDNTLVQGSEAALAPFLEQYGVPNASANPVRLLHMINLFAVDGGLDATQQATVESMQRAQASTENQNCNVDLVHVGCLEDAQVCPQGFVSAAPLERDCRDLAQFKRPRPLPMLFDVLERGAAVGNSDDYLIYTNADICVQPHFYDAIYSVISAGFDAFTINRRTISSEAISQHASLRQSEPGRDHPGFDCFVFSKAAFAKYVRSDCIIGMPAVARPLLYNMVALSQRLLLLKSVSLTYHFGDDMSWANDEFEDYKTHNIKESIATVQALISVPDQQKRMKDFCFSHKEPKPIRAIF